MNYNGIDLDIMKAIQNGVANGSNTVANLKSMYGSSNVDNLIANDLIFVNGNIAQLTNEGQNAMTPLDLSENADLNSDSSSSILFS